MPSMTMTTPASSSSTMPSPRLTPNVNDMTVQQIREHAMREIPAIIKGYSPNSSLSSAKKLGETALAQEGSGNAKQALYQYSMVAALLKHVINQSEFKSNQKELLPVFEDVYKWTETNIIPRLKKLEERLRGIEDEQRMEAEKEALNNLPSVADRIRSLQENGLGVMAGASNAVKSRRNTGGGTVGSGSSTPPALSTKPVRKLGLASGTPLSPVTPSTASASGGSGTSGAGGFVFGFGNDSPRSPPASVSHATSLSVSSTASSSANTPLSTPHAFVPLSSLSVSPPPSPRTMATNTNHHLQAIIPSIIRAPSPEFDLIKTSPLINGSTEEVTHELGSLSGEAERFPRLEDWEKELGSIERERTPNNTAPAATSSFAGPSSPPSTTSSPYFYPSHRPSGSVSTTTSSTTNEMNGHHVPPPLAVSNSNHYQHAGVLPIDRPQSTPIPITPRKPSPPDSPTSTEDSSLPGGIIDGEGEIDPADVWDMQRLGKKVLFLDLRATLNGDENQLEECKGELVRLDLGVWTGREELTADRLTSTVSLRPKNERLLFQNRRSFALIVMIANEDDERLCREVKRALWDMEFRKEWKLKREPVVMRGGWKAWNALAGSRVSRQATGASITSTRTKKITPMNSGSSSYVAAPVSNDGSGGLGSIPAIQPTQVPIPASATASPAPSVPSSLQPGGGGGTSSHSPSPIPPPLQLHQPLPPLTPSRSPRLPLPTPSHQPSPQLPPIEPAPSSAPLPPPAGAGPPAIPSASNLYLSGRDQFWVYKGDEKPTYPTPSSAAASSSFGSYATDQARSPINYGTPPMPSSSASRYESTDSFGSLTDPTKRFRKPALTRPPSSPHLANGQMATTMPNPPSSSYRPTGPISYPSQPLRTPQTAGQSTLPSAFQQHVNGVGGGMGVVSPPPQASINPSPLRGRNNNMDTSSSSSPASSSSVVVTTVGGSSGSSSRTSIDYPDYHGSIRPPPPIAPLSSERDYRPWVPPSGLYNQHQHPSQRTMSTAAALGGGQRLPSDYPVMYWSDYQVSTSGLQNLGNTCYMNGTIQCLAATYPFANYFTDGRWRASVNRSNKLGTGGAVATAFASLLHQMRQGDLPYFPPTSFRKSVCTYAPQFSGSDQHDTEEFLNFLLDGLHEDLNRATQKIPYKVTPQREAELEVLPQQIASEQEWRIYRMSNNSIVVDYFGGQFRNRMQCLTCGKTSTSYNAFTDLALPIPAGRGVSKVTLQQCLDALVREEIMEKTDAWMCPNCKVLRKASKQLSLSRLPAVLIILLKRFSIKGPFTDKLETLVEFPTRSLDLTNYMPPPLPPGSERAQSYPNDIRSLNEDPSVQVPPYRYDLFGVTNHTGSLSGGHYTAFIAARGGWQYCDDSRVVRADTRDIVSKAAYVLYYKRTKP